MTPRGPFRRWFTDMLGFRLGFVLSMALLPVGLLAVLQARSLMTEARARSEAALVGETLRATQPELRLIRQGQGAAEALASVAPILVPAATSDPAGCDSVMAKAVGSSDIYSYAAFLALDGRVLCASDRGVTPPVDAGRIASLDLPLIPTRTEVNDPEDAAGLAAVHPAFAADGRPVGFTLINMPHTRLRAAAATMAAHKDNFALILFDTNGRILSANRQSGEATALLPANRSLVSLTTGDAFTFTGDDTSGTERSFAVMKFADADLFALGSWPTTPTTLSIFRNLPAVVFPLLMWAACLIAAWLAAENLVTTHIRRLRRAITGFSDGRRRVVKLDMRHAPREIREVAEAFEQMTDTILHDEAELEDSLHQKEVLLREVHHRVKNNLQLIASIMSMQMRKTQSSEAKSLMRGLQERVISLATIHKGLYQTTGEADIRANELFPEIVRQVVKLAAGPERRFDVKETFDEIHLTPDQAVPLALLMTEAITNALKYGRPGAERAQSDLSISLRHAGPGFVELGVLNTSAGPGDEAADGAEGTGLGTQLIDAFVRQLNGTIERHHQNGSYGLAVRFPLRTLAEGEERRGREAGEEAAE